MLVLLLSAALIQADSVYASAALREAVARAAEDNREAPAELRSYRALVETEAALVIHTPEGGELTGQIEQIASRVQWWRNGDYAQRVVGHRVQSAGPNVSVISYMERGWTFPVLYGERMGLFGMDTDDPRRGRRRRRGPVYQVVHPFSPERDRIYRFEGGDTVAVLRLPERDVRVMRIRVTPRRPPDGRVLAFHGDIDLDADRHQIVRMRGRLVVFRPEPGLVTRLLSAGLDAVAYVELENAEYEGRYWLPYRQRVELQATAAVTDSRAVVRIVSGFREHEVITGDAALAALDSVGISPDTSAAPVDTAGGAPAPTARRPRFRLTFAPGDTLTRYGDWEWNPGEGTAGLSARDFDDVAPPALRPHGPPHLRFGARRITDVVRFNRIEGLYTGGGAVLAFRDAAPGLELRAGAGWAWSERTARGQVEVALRRDGWEAAVRAARDLDHTNDFTAPLEQGAAIFMLFGAGDDFDYVDRRGVTASIARSFSRADARVRLELAGLEDRPESRRLLRGPYGGDTLRLNRPVAPGSYLLTRLTLERGRSVNGSSLGPGLGARLLLEHAAGELDWRRVEAGLNLRATRGRFLFAARVDGGMVFGDPPPQALYELGTTSGLPGYPYKQFGGDRALLLRGALLYDPPLLDAPIRLGGVVLPGLSPAPVVQWQGGWTAVTSGARPSLDLLGSRETDGIRRSLAFRLTFFGGSIALGIARPLDHRPDWELGWTVGGVL